MNQFEGDEVEFLWSYLIALASLSQFACLVSCFQVSGSGSWGEYGLWAEITCWLKASTLRRDGLLISGIISYFSSFISPPPPLPSYLSPTRPRIHRSNANAC